MQPWRPELFAAAIHYTLHKSYLPWAKELESKDAEVLHNVDGTRLAVDPRFQDLASADCMIYPPCSNWGTSPISIKPRLLEYCNLTIRMIVNLLPLGPQVHLSPLHDTTKFHAMEDMVKKFEAVYYNFPHAGVVQGFFDGHPFVRSLAHWWI